MWDITLPVDEGMPSWPGTPPPTQRWLERIQHGDACDVSAWTLGAHAGTHLDAPSHFIPGAADLETLGLEPLVGPCVVVDAVDAALGPESPRILLRDASTGLTLAVAQSLVRKGVKLVGTDALSIESSASVDAGAPVHKALLAAGVAILEGLYLSEVTEGAYFLVALPLRLQHAEASPVRAILLPETFSTFSGSLDAVSGPPP
jgi:arylformamidase